MQIDNEPLIKEKSSGITICSGTGSTSWHFHINQLSTDAVQSILNICKYKCDLNPVKLWTKMYISIWSYKFYNAQRKY